MAGLKFCLATAWLIFFFLCTDAARSQGTDSLREIIAPLPDYYDSLDPEENVEIYTPGNQEKAGTKMQSLKEISLADSAVKVLGRNEYSYMTYLDSLLRNSIKSPEMPKKETQIDWSWVEWLLWIIGGAAMIWLLFLIFGERVIGRSGKRLVKENAFEDKAKPGTFLSGREKAEQNGAYRLAVRYWFLDTLENMARKEKIILQKEATNAQYLRQLKEPALRNGFKELTVLFEYVWYGEFQPDAEQYNYINHRFRQFHKQWLG